MGRESFITRFPWEQEDSSTLLIKLAFINIRREIETALRPLGLTPQQSQSLHLLAMKPGAMNADLEKLLYIDKSSVTSIINGMVKRGWVVRREHEQDARMKRIFLTDEGLQMYKLTTHAVQQAKDKSNQLLTKDETATLHDLLKKIIKAYE
ncbi:MarR family transcriptional regulator [Paenibacillus sp. LHD-38]|uniref:MarR family winged helix-turn-helix transcriptional regulator n=1 Tax=Paenibacillus sp. LHD-38 TaxID=3072143 RepID=UPI00280D96E4|nr:MarR family transcriptional regulator [Paenibacillus sp. LHD-38]MDQ8738094.1 MarR family transcriptional regulator [Paenibacillus sp. LHD-38]